MFLSETGLRFTFFAGFKLPIDLKSSTQAAEQLGHKKYSLLIQDCFRDLSDLIVKYGGGV